MSRLNVMKVIEPKNRPSQNDWTQEFGFGSMYVRPTDYYQGNEFDSEVFRTGRRSDGWILSGISKLIKTLVWVG